MKNLQKERDAIERCRSALLKRDFLDLMPQDVAKEIGNQTELDLEEKVLTIGCVSFAHAIQLLGVTYCPMVKEARRSPRLTEIANIVRYEWNYGLNKLDYPLYSV